MVRYGQALRECKMKFPVLVLVLGGLLGGSDLQAGVQVFSNDK